MAVQRAVSAKNPYRLSHSLASLDRPDQEETPYVYDADTLLDLLTVTVDNWGRYFAGPVDVWSRVRFDQIEQLNADLIGRWLQDLVKRGDIRVEPLARDPYGAPDVPVDVLTIENLPRFDRWRNRIPIPAELRLRVYDRDGHKCVTCGASEPLSIDHIVPWSKGGPDTFENFQTLCRPCNSRKGARV